MDLENIVIDITQRNYNTLQTIQYDVDSRYVNVKIVNNGKNVDLTNYMVSIACKKPDGKIVFNETEMVEPKQGLIKFLISEQISSALGEVVCELKIYGKNSSVLTTQYFTINVTQPIADKSIQSSNEFRQLTIAMNEYNKWIDKVEEKYNGLEEEYAERLTEISTQLSDYEFKQKLNDFVTYGKIELPDDFFNNIDFEICRDGDGVIRHDANINKYFEGATNIYLAGATGSDTSISGGRDEQTPLRSLTKVFELCEAAVEDSFVINITTEVLPRNYSLPNVSETQLSKSYLIKHKEGKRVYMGSLELNLVYAPEDNVFKTNRSNVAAVFDKKKLCCDGSPRPYKKATTLNECKNTTGSWFNNGNELYINTLDGSTPNGDILVSLNVSAFVVRLTRNNKLALDNICLTYRNASVGSVVVRGNNTGHFIANNCVFTGSAYGNAYYTQGCQYTWLFNCVARDSLRDGFNYHNTVDGKNSFVFEYNCTAYDCGITDTHGNNNATTCHDGMNILRIGSKGRNTKGPVLADIQGCYSINYDCVMHDSTLGGGDTATAFFFSNDGVADKGKYYLFNCSGGGKNTKSIHTYDDAVVKVKNFKGNNIPKKEMIEFIE